MDVIELGLWCGWDHKTVSMLLEETNLFPWGLTVREQKGPSASPSSALSGAVLKAHLLSLTGEPS